LDVGPFRRFQATVFRNARGSRGIERRKMPARTIHWPEYLIEAVSLGVFMISAAGVTTLLRHPSSPLAAWQADPVVQRIPIGVAMGLTLVLLVYSPLGRRSGAHLNPAVTLTFLRLGKIATTDAIGYIAAQFAGGTLGILAATAVFAGLPAHPAVGYVATVPGPAGDAAAFAAEALMSFGMMSLVLVVSNSARLSRFTGVFAGLLVASYIVCEAPISGMSMNPARTLGPNLLAHRAMPLWIYFTAPPLGMLAAAERYARRHGSHRVRCAKLHHPAHGPCIFRCGYLERSSHAVEPAL
jgi:aquaporin Z